MVVEELLLHHVKLRSYFKKTTLLSYPAPSQPDHQHSHLGHLQATVGCVKVVRNSQQELTSWMGGGGGGGGGVDALEQVQIQHCGPFNPFITVF